ncbi:hypothetical protein COBT_003039 [Conglomerata obtusa]
MIPASYSLRIMQLKGSDMYLTNNSGTLVEEKTTVDNIINQYVVIHKRILYFYKDSRYFTLAQSSSDINVKVIESSFHVGKTIEFMESRTVVDAFSLGPDKKDTVKSVFKQTQSRHEEEPRKRGATPHRPRNFSNNQKPSENRRSAIGTTLANHKEKPHSGSYEEASRQEKVIENNNDDDTPLNDSLDQGNDIADKSYNISYSNRSQENAEAEPLQKVTKMKQPKENKHFLDDDELPTEKHKKKQDNNHFIESDSSMEDTVDGCLFRDVIVQEVDRDYFQLVAEKNVCVTSFEKKFIFAACSKKNVRQLFTMVKADDLLRQLRTQIKDESKQNDDEKEIHKYNSDENNKPLQSNIDKSEKLFVTPSSVSEAKPFRNDKIIDQNEATQKNELFNNFTNQSSNKLNSDDLLLLKNANLPPKIKESVTITSTTTQIIPTTVTITEKPVSTIIENKERPKNDLHKTSLQKIAKTVSEPLIQNDPDDKSITSEECNNKDKDKSKTNSDEVNIDSFLSNNSGSRDDEDFLTRMQSMFSLTDLGLSGIN